MVSAEHLARGYYAFKSTVLDLQSFHWHDQILPFSILATLHALRGALYFRYLFAQQRGSTQRVTHVPLLQGLMVNLTLSLGGGILSSMVFGRYIPWLASNWTIPVYSLAHYLVMYSPFDIVFQTLYTFMPALSPLLVIADGISRGFSLTSTIDYLRTTPEPLGNSYVAMVLGGTAAACGGGLLFDIFGMDSLEWRFRTPNFARKLPYGVKVAFIISIGYVAAQTPGLYFNKLIQYILSAAPEFLKPFEKVIIGDIEVSDLKALTCFGFSFILLLEEFSPSPQFKFLSNSEPLEKQGSIHDASHESILDELDSADVSKVSDKSGSKSQSSLSFNRLSSVDPASSSVSSLRKRDILHTPKRFSEHS